MKVTCVHSINWKDNFNYLSYPVLCDNVFAYHILLTWWAQIFHLFLQYFFTKYCAFICITNCSYVSFVKNNQWNSVILFLYSSGKYCPIPVFFIERLLSMKKLYTSISIGNFKILNNLLTGIYMISIVAIENLFHFFIYLNWLAGFLHLET